MAVNDDAMLVEVGVPGLGGAVGEVEVVVGVEDVLDLVVVTVEAVVVTGNVLGKVVLVLGSVVVAVSVDIAVVKLGDVLAAVVLGGAVEEDEAVVEAGGELDGTAVTLLEAAGEEVASMMVSTEKSKNLTVSEQADASSVSHGPVPLSPRPSIQSRSSPAPQ